MLYPANTIDSLAIILVNKHLLEVTALLNKSTLKNWGRKGGREAVDLIVF